MKRRFCAAALALLILCGCSTAPAERDAVTTTAATTATTTATTKATTAKATAAAATTTAQQWTYQYIADVLNGIDYGDNYEHFEAIAQKDGIIVNTAHKDLCDYLETVVESWDSDGLASWTSLCNEYINICNIVREQTKNVNPNNVVLVQLLNDNDYSKALLKVENGVIIFDVIEEIKKKNPQPISYTAELTNGNYTAGIDFPAGVYDIEAIAGTGNVSSSNMFDGGLNMVMSADDPERADSFQNARLPNGVVLEIKNGVTVRISCEEADGKPLAKREQPNTETVTLKNGNYIAGDDFPAGIYNVVAVEGAGTVSSDNMFDGGLNAVMGIGSRSYGGEYDHEYKNIELPEGVTLTVKNVEIQLVPST